MSYCKTSEAVTHAAYEPNMYIVICIIVFIPLVFEVFVNGDYGLKMCLSLAQQACM